jgi:electron transfer flavoprotein alpha subunit
MQNQLENNDQGGIWVIADQTCEKVELVTYQLLGKARELAKDLNAHVACVVLGEKIGHLAETLIHAGSDIVYLAQSPDLRFYQQAVYTQTIVKLARVKKPEVILLGSTHTGRELAPLVAAGLKTGLSAHCIDLCIGETGLLEQKIPAYGGLMTIVCPEKKPQMATCAEGVFDLPEPDGERKGEVIEVAVCTTGMDRIETLEIVKQKTEGITLESAASIVAGGAGAGDREGWQLIREFSDIIGAALGCTRPAVDEGWASLDTMIGQSGKMVSPDLYVGIGLSGEQQHMVGIMDAKVMIAINSDEKSEVFAQVDFGVVDDCKQFLPVLIEKLKQC